MLVGSLLCVLCEAKPLHLVCFSYNYPLDLCLHLVLSLIPCLVLVGIDPFLSRAFPSHPILRRIDFSGEVTKESNCLGYFSKVETLESDLRRQEGDGMPNYPLTGLPKVYQESLERACKEKFRK